MGIEYLTVATCDRCKRETRYDRCIHPMKWEHEWGALWPEAFTDLRDHPSDVRPKLMVCPECMTDAEREQLAESRVRVEEAQLPF